MVNWLQLLNQLNFVWGHIKVFMKCSVIENDGELMLMALHTINDTEDNSTLVTAYNARSARYQLRNDKTNLPWVTVSHYPTVQEHVY